MSSELIQHLSHMSADELRPILRQVFDAEVSPIDAWSVTEIGRCREHHRKLFRPRAPDEHG